MDYLPESLTITVTVPTYDYLMVYSDDATDTMDWTDSHDDRKYILHEPQFPYEEYDSDTVRAGWGYEGWGEGEWGAGWTIAMSISANVSTPGLYTFGVACFDTAGNQGDNGSTVETYQTPRPKLPGDWGADAATYSSNILTVDL